MKRFSLALFALAALTLAACGDDDPAGGGFVDMGSTCVEPLSICGTACVDTRFDPRNCGGCGSVCDGDQVCSMGACAANCPAGFDECVEDGSAVCRNLQIDRRNCGGCGATFRCRNGEVCEAGACVIECQAGETLCGGEDCVDLTREIDNCGACGTVCDPGDVCVGGTCAPNCPDGLTACGGACVDTLRDPANCGACGTACAGNQVCGAGACNDFCPTGLEDCGSTCADLEVDRFNCGECGVTCAAGELCNGGACALVCAEGLADCEGQCVDFNTDRAHCGGCGITCGDAEVCNAGVCELSCSPGLTACDGGCFDLNTSEDHCGRCSGVCLGDETCEMGSCELDCDPGFTNCRGTCVDLTSSATNCGLCGAVCGERQICVDSRCAISTECPVDFTLCGDVCSDLRFDPANCGACGSFCPRGQACVDSVCEELDIVPGQIIGIGHDFFERDDSADTVLHNAILQSPELGAIDILVYTEFGDTSGTVSATPPSPGGRIGEVGNMEDAMRSTPGRTVRITRMTSSSLLASSLTADTDVFVIPEVERGFPSYTTIASSWRATLLDFIASGGIVILAYDDAYQFLIGPGLIEADPGTSILEAGMGFLNEVQLATGVTTADPLLSGATFPYDNLSASGTLRNIRDVEALAVESGTLRPIIWRLEP